ncbi:formate/nitrite transporter family protein [Wenxinia marina]|uniref:Formate/nitrite family of transporter n=1 Tax=Wenxinia marina DSM 24838 TaxID=1123501 RepID=A0A0D0QF50_9RHOB|nr:formate/nitrite transporter family protein [Wenxinia marina]KIQ70957.1 Formate/nitrite family of transporter [Wenxinia marina DSM 24838]GGL56006.1 formate dehydrogenase [Wenxinia marina]
MNPTDPTRVTDPDDAPRTKASRAAAARTDEQRAEVENEAVEKATHMSARLVYEVVLREGEEELSRPRSSLIFSGLAAGVCIAFSVLGEALFLTYLPDVPASYLLENLGYSLGFMLVIMGRLQLFTENTITTVMPVLTRRSLNCLLATARLWGIVLTANTAGCLVAASFLYWTPAIQPEVQASIHALSLHATGFGPVAGFFKAIPAGLLMAALVWMMSAGQRAEGFFIILTFTWLIAAGDFTHIVAGSVEMFYVVFSGDLDAGPAILGFFLPVLLGNIVGGTAVFTAMAWGQVREEIARS